MSDHNDNQSRLHKLPFDQYGRYEIVATAINKIFRTTGRKVTVLDVGGYRGLLHLFLDKDKYQITTLDMYDVKKKNYVKGDALEQPFDDKHFDIAVSFEVLEHIKGKDRKRFLQEALRVSKNGLLLTAPFSGESNEVGDSEKRANEIWRKIHRTDHPWLHEHIEYGIPVAGEIETIIGKLKMKFEKVGNNNLIDWELMQSSTFLKTMYKQVADNPKILSFFNEHARVLDAHATQYYRYIYYISDAETHVLDDKPAKGYSPSQTLTTRLELMHEIFSEIQTDVRKVIVQKNDQIKALEESLRASEYERIELRTRINKITTHPAYKFVQKSKKVIRRK